MSKKIKFPYSRPTINNSDIRAVLEVMESQYLSQGKNVSKLESAIKRTFNSREAIVCSSGTAALHLLYSQMGLNKNNAIITTPITFLATANAAKMCGSHVYFADVDPISGLVTAETIEEAIKRAKHHIKIITIVHLGGHLCDIENISKVSKKYGCFLVEDACHAPGGIYYNSSNKVSKVGSCDYSYAATYSFHAIKNVTMGEGGCITTNDKNLADKIKLKLTHNMIREEKNQKFCPEPGAPWYYETNELGWNYRANEMSCALGLSQIKRINSIIKKRQKIAEKYEETLKDTKYLTLPRFSKRFGEKSWHLYSLLIDFDKIGVTRTIFMNKMANFSIGSQVHYIPIYLQPYYRNKQINLPGAIKFYNRTLSIPMYTSLRSSDVEFISKKIKDIIASG